MRSTSMATPVRGMSSRAVQAEQTRQQILETAQRLFAELGYDATSLQMIADEMGLTKAAVYYHFHAKSDILHAAMQPGIQQLGVLLDEAAGIRGRRARIEHIIDGFVDFLVQNRHYAVMASTDPERLAFGILFHIPECLPDLADLTDEELRQALRTTILRILR